MTGVSHVRRPSATSLASSSVVSAFVLDAIMKSVFASTAVALPSSRTPRPPAKTSLPPWMIPSPTPGTPSSLRPVSTNFTSSDRRVLSILFACLPAKDSRT